MPILSRSSLTPVALFAAGALSVIAYGYITRHVVTKPTSVTQASHQRATPAQLFQADENVGMPQTAHAAPDAVGEQPTPSATPDVTILIAQATGSDAAKRAAAIEALGSVPKAEAVPVLAQVLETADDADRPRALRSLRALAQRQGDEDNRIRGVVRKVVYHADDEVTIQFAQAMLDDIERDLSQSVASSASRQAR